MSGPSFQTWQTVQDEVLRRIHAREWKPGDLIPNEVDLADEFNCARTTVNRALRSLADDGLLERRRKAGTRIAVQPVAKAVLKIAVIRHEIEEIGKAYAYRLIDRSFTVPPAAIRNEMRTAASDQLLFVRGLHFADNAPYAFEERWINTRVVPDAKTETFEKVSANEWLLEHVPYTRGDITISALSATSENAKLLECPKHSALIAVDRLTWDHDVSVTKVRVLFAAGHNLLTSL